MSVVAAVSTPRTAGLRWFSRVPAREQGTGSSGPPRPAASRTRARPRSRGEYGHLLGTATVVVGFGRDGTPRRRRNRPRRLLRPAARPRGDRDGGFPAEVPRGVRRALLGTGRPAARRLLGRAGVLGPRARDGG